MERINFKQINKVNLHKNKKNRIGIVFGGGGTRGFVHLGVIKALEEYGLKFDVVAGTSAGSIIGAFYAAGYTYEQMYNIAKNMDTKDIRTSKIPYKTSKTDGLEKVITDNLGDINIEDLSLPFYAVCTDLISTKEIVYSKGSVAKAVAGSCCVPYIFYPVEYNDKLLVDGGLHNTIPADIPKLMGCDYVIAVDVNKSRTYGTDKSNLLSVVACCFRILMDNSAEKGYKYADLMIRPDTKHFKSTSKQGFEEMIEEGYKETVDNIDKILYICNLKRKSKFEKNNFIKRYEKTEKKIEII